MKWDKKKSTFKCSTLTFRYSTGLVTLNLSMVEIMMAGVVRKKRRRKRMMLMIKQRIHQENPPTDRCSLWENGYVAITRHWAKTHSYGHSWPVNWYCSSTTIIWSIKVSSKWTEVYLLLNVILRALQTNKSMFVEFPLSNSNEVLLTF